jgi:formate hydrogenlyase subunit 4
MGVFFILNNFLTTKPFSASTALKIHNVHSQILSVMTGVYCNISTFALVYSTIGKIPYDMNLPTENAS